MALKQYKPVTPSQRGLVLVDREGLHKGKPVKKLTEGLTKSGGRNNTGRITARRIGGGHKRTYRKSTLSVLNGMFLQRLSVLSMTRTVLRSSRLLNMKTVS